MYMYLSHHLFCIQGDERRHIKGESRDKFSGSKSISTIFSPSSLSLSLSLSLPLSPSHPLSPLSLIHTHLKAVTASVLVASKTTVSAMKPRSPALPTAAASAVKTCQRNSRTRASCSWQMQQVDYIHNSSNCMWYSCLT